MLASALLFLSAACAAAAAAPVGPVANSTEKLEKLVSVMADHQEGAAAAAAAPEPKPLASEGVVLLDAEGEHSDAPQRRQLAGRCTCHQYRNGALGGPVCSKKEGGQNICYPASAGGCPEYGTVYCVGGLSASPAPRAADVVFDAEADADDMFLNVNMRLTQPTSSSQLPAPDTFAHAIALLTGAPSNRVRVLTTLGTSPGVRAAGAVVAQPTEASSVTALASAAHVLTLHATIPVTTEVRRTALADLLQSRTQLPVDGHVFQVAGVEVSEQSANPIACRSEGVPPAESSNLLAQLVQLKQQEVEVMRSAVVQAAQQGGAAHTALLQQIAQRLGVVTAPVA